MVDVTGEQAVDAGERHRQRRVAAIARTAATLASQGSLPAILDALAAEVLQTDALAAVQIVRLDATGGQLRIMGSAGFGHWPDFFDRLMECQRLARDLHDSIVQQVFSISMQAKSMEVLAGRGAAAAANTVPADAVLRIAGEVGALSGAVLADLRAMVHELRLSASADLGGLEEAVRALTDSTANRTGLKFSVTAGPGLDQVQGELAEDVYRIVAEAIHNVVRHAAAERVTIRLSLRGGRLTAAVADDGQGLTPPAPAVSESSESTVSESTVSESTVSESTGPESTGPALVPAAGGYGLTTMRERAERWGGTVTVGPGRRSGTVVRLAVPLNGGIPLAPSGPGGA